MGFLALDHTFGIVRQLRPLVSSIRRHDSKLAAQLRDAGSSVALNLGEAIGVKVVTADTFGALLRVAPKRCARRSRLPQRGAISMHRRSTRYLRTSMRCRRCFGS